MAIALDWRTSTGLLERILRTLRPRLPDAPVRQRTPAIETLARKYDDRLLRDIGLRRADVLSTGALVAEELTAHRAIWRL